MNYKKYFEKLIEVGKSKKEFFPNKINFKHSRDTDHYLNTYLVKGFQYSFVISTSRSTTYGKNFKGVIVELYIDGNYCKGYFEQLKKYEIEIEKELNLNNITITWQEKGESARGTVCRIYAALEVDIEDESRWDEYIDWQINTMIKFLNILPKYTDKLTKNGENSMYEKELKLFINSLEIKDNNLSKKGLELKTLSQGRIFYVYTDARRKKIYANPADSDEYFEHSRTVKNFLNGKPSRENQKNSYGKVIYEYIKNQIENTEKNTLTKEQNFMKNTIKNIILYGVPGVGKTHNTKKLISLLEKNHESQSNIFTQIEQNALNDGEDSNQLVKTIKERVKFITFHQSFGYEDFIEGFRPNEEGTIALEAGVFKDFCKKAEEQKDENFYLVIDEINRGNISKIFGELITLIEEDKRDSLHVTLPYSKKEFSIPSNLYIIGTMNSTDKSIALIDIALRRRFTFVNMVPNAELIQYNKSKELMINLNEKLDKELQIGHSYFMGIENLEELSFTCKYKIKPLLEEYFYGNDKLDEVLDIVKNYV